MRFLMWLAIGFTAACALGVWLLPVHFVIPSAIVLLIPAIALRKFPLRSIPLGLLGCCVGLCWYAGFHSRTLAPALALDGQTIPITVTAVDYSYQTDYGAAVDGELVYKGKHYKIRTYLNGTDEICPGDSVVGEFRLRYTAPGGSQEATYHGGNGTLFLGYQRGSVDVVRGTDGENRYFAVKLRRGVCDILETVFPGDLAPFAKALLLGEDSDLDYTTDTALKISGIRHVIAVSGLHVAILFALLRTVSLNHRLLTAILGGPVLFLFCALAGFTPSVTRACIMVGLMLMAQLVDREYDSATALSFAALVMLAWNPLVITSVSFQMSFACVAGILLFQSSISGWIHEKLGAPQGKSLKARVVRWISSSVSVSLSASVLTIPLSAVYFGAVSLVSVVTNLLTLWAVSLSFYGILAVCLLSLISAKAASCAAFLGALVMKYVLCMVKLLSSIPLAAVYVNSAYTVLWLILVYILLIVFLFQEKRRPLMLGCCAVLGLCIALLASWAERDLSDTHLTALDVGQGQCLILHHDGKTFLIDCGGSDEDTTADIAAQTLLSRGVTHLDGIILTHGDQDHAGALPGLLTRINADFLMLPVTTDQEKVAGLRENLTGELVLVEEDVLLSMNDAKITVYGPEFLEESNENSLCILFESEKCAILITGDRSSLGEMLLMHDAALPDVDLLIAGHHGSKYSTSDELLKTVQPETVFISVGKNSYGHPAESLLERLEALGCEIFRTDLHGTIIFRR